MEGWNWKKGVLEFAVFIVCRGREIVYRWKSFGGGAGLGWVGFWGFIVNTSIIPYGMITVGV